MLKRNVGGVDRVIRAIIGVLLITAFFLYPLAGYRWWAMIIGLILLFTAVMSSCPIYSILHKSTCKIDKA